MTGWSRRAMLAGLAAPVSGCWGLLLHGGTVHSPRSREVEWGVVVLDLLVGLWVPPIPVGLIVDLAAGTIYRPVVHRDGTRGVTVEVCPDAPVPGPSLTRWSRAFARHAAACPACSAALVADGAAAPIPILGQGARARGDVPIVVDLATDTALADARAAAQASMAAVAALG